MVNLTQKVVKGFSSQALVTVVLGVLEVVSFSIMSRLLTREDFGYFAALSAVYILFSSFPEAGFGAALVQKKELDKKYRDVVFTLSLILGFVISGLLIALSGVLSKVVLGEEMRLPLCFMSISLLMNSVSSVNLGILQRQYKFFTIGIIQITALIISTAVAIVLALNNYGYYSIVIKAMFAPVIICFLSFFCAKTSFKIVIDKRTVKAIIGYNGWLMAGRFFRNVSMQLDRILMPRLMSVAMLGEYSRPKEFIDKIASKISDVSDAALFPALSSIQDNNISLRGSVRKTFYYISLFSTTLSLAFALNAPLLIRVFFGEDWLYLTPVFVVLSLAIYFYAVGKLSESYLKSIGKTKALFYFMNGEIIAKLVGIILGARLGGVFGVAIGVVVSECVIRLSMVKYVHYILNLKLKDMIMNILTSWRPLIWILPSSLFIRILLPNSWLGDSLMAAVFILICLVAFLFYPAFIGGKYQNDIYPKLKSIIINGLKTNHEV